MAILFHQNMRSYGPASLDRSPAYQIGFLGIAHRYPGITVSGLTEIRSNAPVTPALLGPVHLALGTRYRSTVMCRRTDASSKEYISIGTADGFEPISYGRVCIEAAGDSAWSSLDIAPLVVPAGGVAPGVPNTAWCNSMPPASAPNYQSVVYAVVRAHGAVAPPVGIGFVHNVYELMGADIRTVLMQQLPNIATQMRRDPTLGAAGRVIICGDFNVAPTNRGTDRGVRMTAYSQGTTAVGAAPAANPGAALTAAQVAAGGTPGGTLMTGNLYDYSYSTDAPAPVPVPRIDTSTMTSGVGGAAGNLSDHCASMLQI